jgi:hypothetical protein
MKVHNMNTVHTLRVCSWSYVDVASLPCIICWIGLSHMLSFYRLYSFCPTAVSRMLEMNTRVGFSVSYTEFTAYVKQWNVGRRGAVCWVWHYYLNLVFQASCVTVNTEQKIRQKQIVSEVWVTFAVYLKECKCINCLSKIQVRPLRLQQWDQQMILVTSRCIMLIFRMKNVVCSKP